MKKKKTRFLANHILQTFELNHYEFPHIIFSFSILRKVCWGMCRSELFDKSLEKEREFMKEKKLIDSRKIKHKIFKRQTFPLHMITYSFLFYYH